MNENTKICLGCMKEINEDQFVCEYCGFEPNKYQVNPRCLQLGTELAGKYVVGKVIGEGGFGITYIGWDLILGLPIAIKEFFPPKIASRDTTSGNNTIYIFDNSDEKSFEEGMKRCVKEAQSMSKLESLQGIVSIRDFFHANKTAYIIMEYVDGITLKKYLEKNGKMPADDVFKIMKPVMQALEQMHAQGIIHRDISPDNIMIRKDGQVKLIDFGAARVAQEDAEKSLTVMLKRGFSPEEQYRSKGHQGSWTDVYALCATLYYMLTGIVPPEAMERVLEDTYSPIKEFKNLELGKNIACAIDKGLNVRAKDRIQTMTELIKEIYGEQENIINIGSEFDETPGMSVDDVGETILDSDGTVLMDESVPIDLQNSSQEVHKFGFGKRKVVFLALALLFIVVIGGSVGFFFMRNERAESAVLLSEPTDTPIRNNATATPLPATPSAMPVTMIDVAGMKIEDAKNQLIALDDTIGINEKEEYSSKVAKGFVTSQDVVKGTEWTPGHSSMQITLVVSKGKEMIKIPNVKKTTKSEAVKKLKLVGLKVETEQAYSSSIKRGYVVSQSKKAGSKVEIHSQVKLVISKGAKPTPKPTQAPTPRATVKPQTTKKPKKSKPSDDFTIVSDEGYVKGYVILD